MNGLWQDLRHGIRALLRTPGFTLVTVITVGLGVGGSATIFSAVNGVLLRPLPYRDPEELVAMRETPLGEEIGRTRVSAPNFIDWREQTRTLDGIAAYRPWGFVLSGGGTPQRIAGARVSPNLFSLLGVNVILGRGFLPGDDVAGNHVVLLSEELWLGRFVGDSGVIGKSLLLDGLSYTVVGIVPSGFQLPHAQIWVPLVLASYELDQRGDRAFEVVGRLKPGTGVAAAREDLNRVALALQQQYPASNAGWSVSIISLHRAITGGIRTPLLLLFAATGTVLLIACTHLAILLLARNVARQREIAVRIAVGAGRSRIIRQLITEHMLTSLVGGGLGLALASVGIHLLANVGRNYLPRSGELGINPVVVGFAVAVSVATGVAFALIAALAASRIDLSQSIKAGATGRKSRRRRLAAGDLAIIGQFALTLTLLVCAGLLVKSFTLVQAVDPGFSAPHVLSMSISLPGSEYPGPDATRAFYQDLLPRLQSIPEVNSVSLVSHLPLSGGPGLSADVTIEDRMPATAGQLPAVQLNDVSNGYFETMSIPVLQGRGFTDDDRTNGRPVVIIDADLARRFWKDGNAVGRRLRLGLTLGADTAWREIVGVVASVRSVSLEAEATPTIYVPYMQNPWPTMSVLVRTTGAPARIVSAVRREILALDPNQPVYSVRSLDDVLAEALASRRSQAILVAGFAITAVLLALLGVYAVFAHTVTQRNREWGIRTALGGQRHDVMALILKRATKLMASGLILGGIGALVAGRLVRSLLFGVSPNDPQTFIGAMLLLAAAGLLASYLPARRATRVDPIIALRAE